MDYGHDITWGIHGGLIGYQLKYFSKQDDDQVNSGQSNDDDEGSNHIIILLGLRTLASQSLIVVVSQS